MISVSNFINFNDFLVKLDIFENTKKSIKMEICFQTPKVCLELAGDGGRFESKTGF